MKTYIRWIRWISLNRLKYPKHEITNATKYEGNNTGNLTKSRKYEGNTRRK